MINLSEELKYDDRKIVSPSDKAFSYMGRIDFSKP